MFRKAYSPGDPVPENIFFWVHHYQHRLPHIGQTILKTFPLCATCGDKVRYEPIVVSTAGEATLLRFDSDFKPVCDQMRSSRPKKKAAR